MRLPVQPGLAPIRVLIADPSTMTRGLISAGLKRHSQFKVVGSVSQADELLCLLEQLSPDVALISATLEGKSFSGLSILSQIHSAYPKLRLIVLMDRSEPDVVVQAFHSGARGVFAHQESDFKALCKCVWCVHKGQIWAATQHIEHLISALGQTPRLRVVNSEGSSLLSKREEDVVRLVAEGMGNREISEQLDLSEHTVKNYLFRIFDKLGVSNRTELVLYAVSCPKEQVLLIEPSESLERAARPRTPSEDLAGPLNPPGAGTARLFKAGQVPM